MLICMLLGQHLIHDSEMTFFLSFSPPIGSQVLVESLPVSQPPSLTLLILHPTWITVLPARQFALFTFSVF